MSIHTDHPIPNPRHRRQPPIPDTPEALAHAAEAEALKNDLKDLADYINAGVPLVEQVSPSSDGRGHVRMNFRQVKALLDYIESLESETEEVEDSHA